MLVSCLAATRPGLLTKKESDDCWRKAQDYWSLHWSHSFWDPNLKSSAWVVLLVHSIERSGKDSIWQSFLTIDSRTWSMGTFPTFVDFHTAWSADAHNIARRCRTNTAAVETQVIWSIDCIQSINDRVVDIHCMWRQWQPPLLKVK